MFGKPQTGSRYLILEVYGFGFSLFLALVSTFFKGISTKFHTELKLSNADFVLSKK